MLEVSSGEERTVNILHESSFDIYLSILKDLKEVAKDFEGSPDAKVSKWKEYYKFRDKTFALAKYNYAITCHKSQGSEYDFVFIDLDDILSNSKVKERNRILYTSITRARQTVFLLY